MLTDNSAQTEGLQWFLMQRNCFDCWPSRRCRKCFRVASRQRGSNEFRPLDRAHYHWRERRGISLKLDGVVQGDSSRPLFDHQSFWSTEWVVAIQKENPDENLYRLQTRGIESKRRWFDRSTNGVHEGYRLYGKVFFINHEIAEKFKLILPSVSFKRISWYIKTVRSSLLCCSSTKRTFRRLCSDMLEKIAFLTN